MLGFEGTVVSSRDWDVFRAGVRPWHGGSACGGSSPPFRTNDLARNRHSPEWLFLAHGALLVYLNSTNGRWSSRNAPLMR